MLRQMMLFHVRALTDPQQRIDQALALLKFLAESQTKSDTYTDFLKEELEDALKLDVSHLFHDQLGNVNTPVYFYQFMDHAVRHGLQFLGEADFFEMQYHIYPPNAVDLLSRMAAENVILKEQYLDFLKCRRFRQTLLCRVNVELNREPQPELLKTLYLASPARAASDDPDLSSPAVEEFRGRRGAMVATDYPLAKAALAHLGSIYPRSIHFTELLAQARNLSGTIETGRKVESRDEVQVLAEILLHTYATGMLELFPRAPDYTSKASERPIASPLARWQIQQDTVVTNMRHINVEVEDELGKQLLLLLDGTRDRPALLEDLGAIVKSGGALLEENGAPVRDPKRAQELLVKGLEASLGNLARLALLAA
jgi:methyltransferase-like protein